MTKAANGYSVRTYTKTVFGDYVFNQEFKLDSRKKLSNLIIDAEYYTSRIADDAYRIVEYRGGDIVQVLTDINEV